MTACSTAAAPAQHSREKKWCIVCALYPCKTCGLVCKANFAFCWCCCFGSVCTHCSNNIQHVRGSIGWVSLRIFKDKPPPPPQPPKPKILKALNPPLPSPQINWKCVLQWVPSVFPSMLGLVVKHWHKISSILSWSFHPTKMRVFSCLTHLNSVFSFGYHEKK